MRDIGETAGERTSLATRTLTVDYPSRSRKRGSANSLASRMARDERARSDIHFDEIRAFLDNSELLFTNLNYLLFSLIKILS